MTENKEKVSEDDVKRYAKLIAFCINNWQKIVPAIMFLSALACGAVTQYKHNQYIDNVVVPAFGKRFDSLLAAERTKNDTIKTLINNDQKIADCLDNIFYYKLPYGKWGKTK